jgi:hypothetical protein
MHGLPEEMLLIVAGCVACANKKQRIKVDN